MTVMNNKCAEIATKLADLLFDPEAAPAKVRTHVAGCESCRKELGELKATMALMDTWEAPEPSPYFLTRMDARMREERAAEPQGWLARKLAGLRAGFAYGPPMHARPLAAMALTLVLLVGGGTYLSVSDLNQPVGPAAPEAVVHDLQTLDNNAQLLDQMEALSSNNDNGD